VRRRRLNPLIPGIAFLLFAPTAMASNDSSATPTPLTFGQPEQINTSAYTVQPGEQNTVAPFTQQCESGHNVGAARTAWYTVRGTGHRVVVSSEGSSFDTALFAYENSPGGPLAACNDDLSGSDLQSSVSLNTASGRTYAIQVGRACNETGPPTCASRPPTGTLRVTATDVAPTPRLSIKSSFSVRFFKRFTRFTSLTVTGAPRGSKVVLQCKSRRRGCPFRRLSKRVKSRRAVRFGKRLKHAHLKPRARLTIRVTKPGFIGWLRTYTIRSGKLPKKRTYCLRPASTKPRRHCS
jgi:hypothetical protein